jgi:ABC-type transport system involved in cytochrome c biogenesis permease subunit
MIDIGGLVSRLETQLFLAHLFALLAAVGAYAAARKRWWGRSFAAAAALFFLGSVAVRSVAAGRIPLASVYEFGLLLELVLLGFVFFIDRAFSSAVPSVVFAGSTFVLASVQLLLFQDARPLMPALKSWWLTAHVLTAVAAYGLIMASAVLAAVGLAWREAPPRLERLVVRLVFVAFPFLTLLILTGAVWAEYAWGSFWRWDPKETWALITWLVYLSIIHLSSARGWRGRKVLWLSIAGFAVVVFTFYGVNYLLSGLHSYA